MRCNFITRHVAVPYRDSMPARVCALTDQPIIGFEFCFDFFDSLNYVLVFPASVTFPKIPLTRVCVGKNTFSGKVLGRK